MNERNLGFFKLPSLFVKNRPECVAKVFSLLKIVPLKVTRDSKDMLEYLALSEKFIELRDSELIPEYVLKITEDGSSLELVVVKKTCFTG